MMVKLFSCVMRSDFLMAATVVALLIKPLLWFLQRGPSNIPKRHARWLTFYTTTCALLKWRSVLIHKCHWENANQATFFHQANASSHYKRILWPLKTIRRQFNGDEISYYLLEGLRQLYIKNPTLTPLEVFFRIRFHAHLEFTWVPIVSQKFHTATS